MLEPDDSELERHLDLTVHVGGCEEGRVRSRGVTVERRATRAEARAVRTQ